MREKTLHAGSKVYEGKRVELPAAFRLQDIASGHEKKFSEKMREKALHVGSNIYGGRKDGIKVQHHFAERCEIHAVLFTRAGQG